MAQITKPGIYAGIDIRKYHSQELFDGPSISSSGLRKIANESPAHFYSTWDGNPDREEVEESRALVLGQAAHHLLLGEADFSTRFIMRPEELAGKPWQGNRTDCKNWLELQAERGRTVIKPDEVKIIRGMARSLGAHPLIKSGLLNGAVEQTIAWKCPETGVWLKARPDVIPNDGMFADLKTTTSVLDDDLRRTIYDYGYAQQGALVCEGYTAVTGIKDTSFTLVFVEKTAPYCVRVITLTDVDMARGEQLNRMAKLKFKACLDAGEWPGPGNNDAEFMGIPKFAADRQDAEIERWHKENPDL